MGGRKDSLVRWSVVSVATSSYGSLYPSRTLGPRGSPREGSRRTQTCFVTGQVYCCSFSLVSSTSGPRVPSKDSRVLSFVPLVLIVSTRPQERGSASRRSGGCGGPSGTPYRPPDPPVETGDELGQGVGTWVSCGQDWSRGWCGQDRSTGLCGQDRE